MSKIVRHHLVDIEADAAPEGSYGHGHWRENQGDFIPPAPRAIKVPRATTPLFLPLVGLICILAVAAFSLIAYWSK